MDRLDKPTLGWYRLGSCSSFYEAKVNQLVLRTQMSPNRLAWDSSLLRQNLFHPSYHLEWICLLLDNLADTPPILRWNHRPRAVSHLRMPPRRHRSALPHVCHSHPRCSPGQRLPSWHSPPHYPFLSPCLFRTFCTAPGTSHLHRCIPNLLYRHVFRRYHCRCHRVPPQILLERAYRLDSYYPSLWHPFSPLVYLNHL